MYGHYLEQSNMGQPRKVAKPARGQLSREIKCPYRCIRIRGKYIYYMYWYSTAVCICLYTRYTRIFYLGTCTFFVHGLLLYMHIICVTTAVCI